MYNQKQLYNVGESSLWYTNNVMRRLSPWMRKKKKRIMCVYSVIGRYQRDIRVWPISCVMTEVCQFFGRCYSKRLFFSWKCVMRKPSNSTTREYSFTLIECFMLYLFYFFIYFCNSKKDKKFAVKNFPQANSYIRDFQHRRYCLRFISGI